MVKTVVLYKEPADKEAFDNHYFGVHVPLVNKIPGLVKFEATKFMGGMGGASPYYLMAELYFNSPEEMNSGMGSAEGQVTAADLPNLADPSTVTIIFGGVAE